MSSGVGYLITLRHIRLVTGYNSGLMIHYRERLFPIKWLIRDYNVVGTTRSELRQVLFFGAVSLCFLPRDAAMLARSYES